MRLKVSPCRYRVLDGKRAIYVGDDLRQAVIAFNRIVLRKPGEDVHWHDGAHSVTGEPLLEARDQRTGKLVAVLYGASHEDFAKETIRMVAEAFPAERPQ